MWKQTHGQTINVLTRGNVEPVFGVSKGLGRRQVGITLATVMLLSVLLADMGQVAGQAITITPDPPTAGQPFNVMGLVTITSSIINLVVGHGSCISLGTIVYSVTVFGYFTVTVPGQSAGSYYAALPNSCVDFTVIPAPPIPEYPLGLPILATFIVIGYVLIRRKVKPQT